MSLAQALRDLIARYEHDGIPNDSLPTVEAARAALAQHSGFDQKCLPEGIRPKVYTILNASQLHQALQLACDDLADPDQWQTDVVIRWWPGGKDTDGDDQPDGYYAHLEEYPEEGALYLDPDRLIDGVGASHLSQLVEALEAEAISYGGSSRSFEAKAREALKRARDALDAALGVTPSDEWLAQAIKLADNFARVAVFSKSPTPLNVPERLTLHLHLAGRPAGVKEGGDAQR